MADSPDVAAGKRLIDQAKAGGFVFTRTAEGEDAPLLGIRETLEFVDEIVLTGFWAEGSCYASRRGRGARSGRTGTSKRGGPLPLATTDPQVERTRSLPLPYCFALRD